MAGSAKNKAAEVSANPSLFQKILASTGQDVLDKRAQITFNASKAAMNDHLTSLYRQRDQIELDILNLTDLSVETRDSLRPGSKDFKPGQWVKQMCDFQKALALLEDDIMIAEQVASEYFNIASETQEA